MKKLCICIPTYKRESCIAYILEKSLEWTKTYDVDYYICDSSSSDETKNVIDSYKKNYGSHLIYRRLDNYMDKTSDLKVAECFKEIVDKYEYIHMCGDGLVLQLNEYFTLIDCAFSKKYDLIHFNAKLNDSKREYKSGLKFASESGWYATYYGATTMSSRLIKKANYHKALENLRNTGFLYWFGMISAVASDDEKILAINHFPLENNPFKPTNTSYQPGKFINFWVKAWPRVIDELPEYYNDIKPQLKRDMGEHVSLYSLSNLLRLRLSDNLEWNQVRKLKKNFGEVTNTPYYKIAIISIAPKFFISCLVKIKTAFGKLRKKVKGEKQ